MVTANVKCTTRTSGSTGETLRSKPRGHSREKGTRVERMGGKIEHKRAWHTEAEAEIKA